MGNCIFCQIFKQKAMKLKNDWSEIRGMGKISISPPLVLYFFFSTSPHKPSGLNDDHVKSIIILSL